VISQMRTGGDSQIYIFIIYIINIYYIYNIYIINKYNTYLLYIYIEIYLEHVVHTEAEK